jgi:hypothetical protein
VAIVKVEDRNDLHRKEDIAMKARRSYLLGILVFCASVFLSVFLVGFIASYTQASDEVKQERIASISQPGGIVGGVGEGTPTSVTVKKDSADKGDKGKEKPKKEEKKKKEPKEPKPPSSDPWPGWPCLPEPNPYGYGCWDY